VWPYWSIASKTSLRTRLLTFGLSLEPLVEASPDLSRDPHLSRGREFVGCPGGRLAGVLELAVRQSLYDKHDAQEGGLSKMAADLVCDDNLTKVAIDMDLERHLFLGGTEVSDEKGKPAILADALEAIMGAIYLDQGLEVTIEVVERLILCREAKSCIPQTSAHKQ
jgi:hypothetical protein